MPLLTMAPYLRCYPKANKCSIAKLAPVAQRLHCPGKPMANTATAAAARRNSCCSGKRAIPECACRKPFTDVESFLAALLDENERQCSGAEKTAA